MPGVNDATAGYPVSVIVKTLAFGVCLLLAGLYRSERARAGERSRRAVPQRARVG